MDNAEKAAFRSSLMLETANLFINILPVTYFMYEDSLCFLADFIDYSPIPNS